MAGTRPTAITKLQDAPSVGKRNWLIYGAAGIGKTSLAGTAPNAIFLAVEAAGTESAKMMGSSADEWIIDNWSELRTEAYEYFKNGSGCKDYEWVLIDSGSEMEEIAWQDQLETAHARNAARSLYKPALEDYQIIGNKMKNMVDAFNRLPINVLYTFQDMRVTIEDQDTEEEKQLIMPLVGSPNNGIISTKICGKTTLNGWLTVRRVKIDSEGEGVETKDVRRLYTSAGKRFIAKDRHDTFGRFVDNPNITEMAEAVQKKIDKAKTTEEKMKAAGLSSSVSSMTGAK